MCSELQGYLDSFNSTLTTQWNGQKSDVAFSAELLSANNNMGLGYLLDPATFTAVIVELNADAQLGVQAVKIEGGYPILDPQFYSFPGVKYSYTDVVNFYKKLVGEIRRRGLKLVIEVNVLFPTLATDLPLKAYFSSLSLSQIAAGRAVVAQTIAEELQPDWLTLGAEPDTESLVLGFPSEMTPQQYASYTSTCVTQLRGAGINGHPLIGAGIGDWQMNALDYIQALGTTGIDFLDVHVDAVNLGWLADVPGYLQAARAAGIKGAGFSEAWLKKASDEQLKGASEYQILLAIGTAADPLNAYSFWEPLDTQFIGEVVDLAYWQGLYFMNPFWSPNFFAYLDYNNTAGMTSPQVQSAWLSEAAAAHKTGFLTATGQAYEAAVARPTRPATASAASGALHVSAESIVSVYGPTLGGSGVAASSLPLPVSLGGVSVTVTDNTGAEVAAPLFYAGPQQINAEIPPGMNTGLAAITVTSSAGVMTGPVTIDAVAPSVFAANQSGKGIAAAQVATNSANNTQTVTDVFHCTPSSCAPNPIDLSKGSSALVLYGTGIRHRASLSDVTVSIGDQRLPAAYAGPTPGYVGLDQVNVALPGSLEGSGTVDVSVSIAGTVSNNLTVTFK